MKRIAITLVCLMLIVGCAFAGQPNQPASQTKETTDENLVNVAKLNEMIKAAAEKVEKLPLWKQRQEAIKEAVSKDPKVKDVESRLSKTQEWITLQNLLMLRNNFKNIK